LIVAKTYLLEDVWHHPIDSLAFVELCELPLGDEPLSYLVTANCSVERDRSWDQGSMEIAIRLDVLDGFSVLLGRDEARFEFDGVEGEGSLVEDDSGRHWVQFQHGIIHRHVSLTVAATFTVERGAEAGGFEMAQPREGFGEAGGLRHFWYPRAILSASGKIRGGRGADLRDIRIVAFPADEIVVKTNR
jgi:hypothetical protein